MSFRWLSALLAAGFLVQPAASQVPSLDPPPQADNTANSPPAENRTDLRGNPLWDIPLASLTWTNERPLFLTARRRPPAPVEAAAPPPPPPPAPKAAAPEIRPPQLTLVGAIIGTSDAVVIFIDNSTRETVRLRTGEGYAGWILRSAKHSEATLERGGATAKFVIPPPSGEKK